MLVRQIKITHNKTGKSKYKEVTPDQYSKIIDEKEKRNLPITITVEKKREL